MGEKNTLRIQFHVEVRSKETREPDRRLWLELRIFQVGKFWMIANQDGKRTAASGKCMWTFVRDKKLCKCEKKPAAGLPQPSDDCCFLPLL